MFIVIIENKNRKTRKMEIYQRNNLFTKYISTEMYEY